MVTVVAGRHDHLRRQLDGLARSTVAVRHTVVAMGDRLVRDICDGHDCAVVDVPVDRDGLPLAAARNAGARAALRSGADLLVFLDVDCVPVPELADRYATAAGAFPDAVLSGPVTYLPPPGPDGYDLSDVGALLAPHPGRPSPPDGEHRDLAYELFWSLSFALTAATWRRIGGFCEDYVGYGGEDTDFGQLARASGVAHRMVGGAHAVHQWHPVEDLPVRHVADLLRNGALFARRWGWWPMRGWLDALVDDGVVVRVGDGYAAVA